MILRSFGGIIPRLAESMLAINQATIAHDVKLRDGVIAAWQEPCEFAAAVTGARTIYLYGCCALSWDAMVDVAELTPDWGRIYITGRDCQPYLETAEMDCSCNPKYLRVGVPAPPTAPVASCENECDRETDARSYVYTYVTAWGEESPPSPPSNIVRPADGSPVVVSGFRRPDSDYGVVYINIYRTATGFREMDGKIQKPLTDFLYVGRIPVGQSSFTDTVLTRYLGVALETMYDRPPPEMAGVVAIPDQVRLAGFNKNKVYFSEPHQAHNWPAKYDLTLDYNIVHMRALDQRLFVTTQSVPYVIDVSGCDPTKCVPVSAIDTPLPDIGCHYSHGAIITYHGLFYASPFGIILLQPNGQWHIVTAKWFGEKEWLKLRPDTIRMAYWEGYLFFATDMGTFLLDINGRPYGDMDMAELSTLSDVPMDMITTATGKMMFLQDDKIWVWNGGNKYRPYIWESRQITASSIEGKSELLNKGPLRDNHWWPTAIKLHGSGRVQVRDSHEHPFFDRLITTEKWHRMRRVGRHLWYRLRLTGDTPIEAVSMGTDLFGLNKGV